MVKPAGRTAPSAPDAVANAASVADIRLRDLAIDQLTDASTDHMPHRRFRVFAPSRQPIDAIGRPPRHPTGGRVAPAVESSPDHVRLTGGWKRKAIQRQGDESPNKYRE